MSWVAPTIGGLFGLVDSGLSAIYSASSAKKQYKYNLALQNDAQKHQEHMYKNQHQWAVEDLRSAGLNPILSSHSASSMPSAGMNSVSMAPPVDFDIMDSIAKWQGYSSAKDMQHYAKENHEVDLAQKESDLLNSILQGEKIKSDIKLNDSNSALNNFNFSRVSRKWNQIMEDMERLNLFKKSNSQFGGMIKDILTDPMQSLIGTLKMPLPESYYDDGRIHKDFGSSAIQIKKSDNSLPTKYRFKYHKR